MLPCHVISFWLRIKIGISFRGNGVGALDERLGNERIKLGRAFR